MPDIYSAIRWIWFSDSGDLQLEDVSISGSKMANHRQWAMSLGAEVLRDTVTGETFPPSGVIVDDEEEYNWISGEGVEREYVTENPKGAFSLGSAWTDDPEQVEGAATILWHTTYGFNPIKPPPEIYERITQELGGIQYVDLNSNDSGGS